MTSATDRTGADHGDAGPAISTALAAVIYFGLSLLYFLPAFLPGHHLFGTDYLAGGYFFMEFVSNRLAEGSLPKWVPYIYGGLPLLANPGSTFFPVRLIADYFLPTTWILPLIFVVQFGFGGLGTYLLTRELGCRKWVAFLAGLAFEFTGITLSSVYAGHDGRVIAATFAPLVFFFLHRGIRTGRAGPFVGMAATIGFSLLSFQIQSNYYLLIAASIWALFCLFHLGVVKEKKTLRKTVTMGLVAVAFGFVLASVNFLPFLDYVPQSPRGAEGGRGYEYSIGFSMPPEELLSVAVPEQAGVLQNYQGRNPFKLHTEYLGALVVVLGVLSFSLSRKNRYWWFFGALGLFALSISFGGNTPLYRLYYEFLPGTARFRAPSLSFFLFALSAVVMAAITLERLAGAREAKEFRRGSAAGSRKAPRADGQGGLTGKSEGASTAALRPGVWLAAVVAVSIAGVVLAASGGGSSPHDAAVVTGWARFALFTALVSGGIWLWWTGKLRTTVFVTLVSVVTVADLWIVGRNFFETVPPPDVTFARDDVVDFLERQGNRDRVWVLPFGSGVYQNQGNYLMRFGIEQAGGEHGNSLQRYHEFVGAGQEVYVDWHNLLENQTFLDAANIRYIISMVELNSPRLREVHRGSAIVYENLSALPRAYLVEDVITPPDTTSAISIISAPDFDPTRSAVVYGAAPGTFPAGPLEGSADIVESTPDRIVIRTRSSRPALLVLSDNWYDGWVATVNGSETPVYRANHTFRGVRVGEGESEVVFEFHPRQLYIGLYIYLAGMSLLVGYVVWLLWSNRQRARRTADGVPVSSPE
ncbi:MAG: YfhO family protein [Gemmatimonadota bacterium]|jgi:uncharacterized membrane protein YwzB|nr:YfhO family protein [Gemmatimonadota bacterium]